MRVTSRLIAAVATVAVPLAAAVAAPAVASGAPAPTPTVKVLACTGGRAQVRPRTILIACGDGSYGVTRLHWNAWGGPRARATGSVFVNDCDPDCAAGHFHFFRADVVLTRISRDRYRDLTVTSAVTPHRFRTRRESLPG